jgi:hypothetical protein
VFVAMAAGSALRRPFQYDCGDQEKAALKEGVVIGGGLGGYVAARHSSHSLARRRSGGAGVRGPMGSSRARAAWVLAGAPPFGCGGVG